jgi:hypothetical protein
MIAGGIPLAVWKSQRTERSNRSIDHGRTNRTGAQQSRREGEPDAANEGARAERRQEPQAEGGGAQGVTVQAPDRRTDSLIPGRADRWGRPGGVCRRAQRTIQSASTSVQGSSEYSRINTNTTM